VAGTEASRRLKFPSVHQRKDSCVVEKRVVSRTVRAGVGVKFKTSKSKRIMFVGHKAVKKAAKVAYRAKKK
jgi:hypothetical protein